LYQLDSAVAAEVSGTDPVLLYAFDGFVDAGIAAGLAINDFLVHGQARRLATLAGDELLDYRSRRPPMVIGQTGWEAVHTPELAIDLVNDAEGRGFLLCYGPEPDLRWEAFAEAVGDIATGVGVAQAIGMYGVPSPTPHTRGVKATGPAPGSGLIRPGGRAGTPRARIQVPGSAGSLLDYRLAERGIEAGTVIVHIPHYLVATPYPAGTIAMLEQIAATSPLRFDLTRLADAAEATDREIDRQVAGTPELAEMIAQLEAEHDDARLGGPLALPGEPLPDAEAIAAELEAFLAEQNRGRDGTDPGER
jgi:hypothetical protein